ncbi:ADP-ribosylglycohydrolase family protein [Neorhodopirellula pilleata]|uniref:ADP-ribosylglycohydrolase n=1 Tax=Neorhodopirellula pilleata TaxID=2714738 RepID=A0A5C6A0M6_9BACT|nr:ADP-ribosylglycohydrolase family protein [Neorhodopirellula pilleata]TWT92955.1 ADP-ribosylglycohydrolase [Neorhodopirellula pilleata]
MKNINDRQYGFFSNEPLFDWIAQRRIGLADGRAFDRTPPRVDASGLVRQGRLSGMLWGVAVGDALGHSTEWKHDPASRNRDHGTIVDHLTDGTTRAGRVSDDTQFTFWMLRRLLDDGAFQFDHLIGDWVQRRGSIVGAGRNTVAALDRHQRRLAGEPLDYIDCLGDLATEGRGNGALMRFAPIVLPHLANPSSQLYVDAVMAALITHGNPFALSSIVAMTDLLWQMLLCEKGEPPTGEFYFNRYIEMAADLEVACIPSPYGNEPVPRWYQNFHGNLSDFIDGPVRRAFRKGVSFRDACSLDGFGSRADVLQTVPAVLYLMACHADSFESTIIAAVNDTKDNDTIAAIAGALVGACHGRSAIRRRWIDGITSTSIFPPEPDGASIESMVAAAEGFVIGAVS